MYIIVYLCTQLLIFYDVVLPDLDPPDINFNLQGYLLLAADKKGEDILHRNHKTQMYDYIALSELQKQVI